MRTEIYYFSGTGNSLFAAAELQKRLPGSVLIPIVSLLGQKAIRTNAEAVGFVFPVHALTIPIAVKRFIEKTDFSSAEYLFAVATREGTIFRGFEKINSILKKSGKQLHAHVILNMYNNEARHEGYKVPSRTDILALEKPVLEKLDIVQELIKNKRISLEKDDTFTIDVNCMAEKTVLFAMDFSEHIGGVNYFYKDLKCCGCGICAKVCLSGKIRMCNGKPEWQKKVFCYMCFACLNYCPRRAVQIKSIPGVKSFTESNGRYPHPYAEAGDIAAQKPSGR